jgi:two-component system response regulator QseB
MHGAAGKRPRVVIFEDDGDTAALLREILDGEGFDALTADRRTPLDVVARHRPRLLLLDVILGRLRGSDVRAALRRAGLAHVPIVLLSGKPDLEHDVRELGAVAFVPKPFDIDQLVATCRDAAA